MGGVQLGLRDRASLIAAAEAEHQADLTTPEAVLRIGAQEMPHHIHGVIELHSSGQFLVYANLRCNAVAQSVELSCAVVSGGQVRRDDLSHP